MTSTSSHQSLLPPDDPSPRTPPRGSSTTLPGSNSPDTDLTPRPRKRARRPSSFVLEIRQPNKDELSTVDADQEPPPESVFPPKSVQYGFSVKKVGNLYRLLLAEPPKMPPVYQKGALTKTKKITNTEAALVSGTKLRRVVFLRRLVKQLIPTAKGLLEIREIDERNRDHFHFTSHVLPEVIESLLPRRIYSEKDVASWCDATLFRPALAALRAVRIVPVKGLALVSEPIYPYMASAPAHKIIPDSLLVCNPGGSDSPGAVFGMTIEHKSPAALEHVIADLLGENTPDVMALPFDWPSQGELNDRNSLTRIFVQIWAQITDKKCRQGALSSSFETLFFVSGEGDTADTLFVSPSYRRLDAPILATFCWMALADGLFDISDLKLPAHDEIEELLRPGVVRADDPFARYEDADFEDDEDDEDEDDVNDDPDYVPAR